MIMMTISSHHQNASFLFMSLLSPLLLNVASATTRITTTTAAAFLPSFVSKRKENHFRLYSSTIDKQINNQQGGHNNNIALPPALTIDSLTCSHDGGSTYQLNDVFYVLPRTTKVGLVGRNGCGKSTLLRILASECSNAAATGVGGGGGIEDAIEYVKYSGRVECPRDVSVAYVEQDPPSPSDVTVLDALLGVTSTSSSSSSTSSSSSNSIYDIVRNYQQCTISTSNDVDAEQFAKITTEMDNVNGWSVLTKVDEIASKLRVKHLQSNKLNSLSGGERKRVALAAALVKEPDVLLLDEPTNHLDLSAIRWLSDLIKSQRKLTLLTITHDRAFLEDVCTKILELDNGQLYSYDGNYASYLEGKELRLANQDAKVRAAKSKYRVELEWMRRQPQARESKSKARIDAFYKLEKATKPRVKDVTLDLFGKDGQRRLGGNILKMKDISLSFDNRKMLDEFTYDFNKGDKIGIVGANGVGKSTFIKVLTGAQPIDNGTIETGETIVFGVYDQMGIDLTKDEEDMRVLDYVKERVEARDGSSMAEAPQEAMKLLKQFQFERQRWNERVSMLSGGEKRRLQLLSVLTKRPNFLILDEPTNDLDLDTLSALEAYLDEFNGVLVVVSHDRFFTDKVTDHLFVFEGNGSIKDYLGSLSDYAECLVDQEKAGPMGEGAASISNSKGGIDKKVSYKEEKEKRLEKRNAIKKMRREMDNLEPSIEKLKVKAAAIQEEMDNSSEEGWTVLAELSDKVQKVNDEIDEKEMRWLELAEMLEIAEAAEEENS